MSMDDIAALLKAGSVKRVVFCVGAGISTAAGIPDFRSPKTGLYHNLRRLNLEYPEQVFEIDFFRRDPRPFYELAHELYPGKFMPTLTHAFMHLLDRKKQLLRVFTQNIDTLERRAGVPAERIVEAHGSFATNRCIVARCRAPAADISDMVLEKKIPRCRKCGGLVKPDIVFFGEALPDLFHERLGDLRKADLVIVAGTSLQVQPFASLPERAGGDVPRLLLNMEDVGDFDREMDVVKLGKCDDSFRELAQACGWEDELVGLHEQIVRDCSPTGGPAPADPAETMQKKTVNGRNSESSSDEHSRSSSEDVSDGKLEGAREEAEELAEKLAATKLNTSTTDGD